MGRLREPAQERHRDGLRSRNLLRVARTKLGITAQLCLLATAALAVAVAHSRAPYSFEARALAWLGPPRAIGAWVRFAGFLGAPAIGVVLVASLVFGWLRRILFRVVFFAVLAAVTLLVSEHVFKPLVQRTYEGELTFPSGTVTAVTATAFAMWLALSSVLGRRAVKVTFLVGTVWALLISLAVVGAHWHTPLDDVGSLFLSVGVVCAGSAAFEWIVTRRPAKEQQVRATPTQRVRACGRVRRSLQERSASARR